VFFRHDELENYEGRPQTKEVCFCVPFSCEAFGWFEGKDNLIWVPFALWGAAERNDLALLVTFRVPHIFEGKGNSFCVPLAWFGSG